LRNFINGSVPPVRGEQGGAGWSRVEQGGAGALESAFLSPLTSFPLFQYIVTIIEIFLFFQSVQLLALAGSEK